MIKAILFYIILWLLPVLASAQMAEFQQNLLKANKQFLLEKKVVVKQRFIFSLDSATALPFDSGYCVIEKNDPIIHYHFGKVESFNDGEYLIRISDPAKYMVVSHSNPSDSSQLGLAFREGFSNFKNAEKKMLSDKLFQWNLTGGENGVFATEIIFDAQKSRIQSLLAELSADHPFVSQIKTGQSGRHPNVFVRIDYTYSKELNKEQPKRSDYIQVKNDTVTPAEKYIDYQIKFIK